MLPLGGMWSGTCCADAGRAGGTVCNLGYARGRCPRFPGDATQDAVRFALATATPEAVTIRYSIERDHRHCGHGTLELPVGQAPWPVQTLLERQARAYLHSYLRRIR